MADAVNELRQKRGATADNIIDIIEFGLYDDIDGIANFNTGYKASVLIYEQLGAPGKYTLHGCHGRNQRRLFHASYKMSTPVKKWHCLPFWRLPRVIFKKNIYINFFFYNTFIIEQKIYSDFFQSGNKFWRGLPP